MENKKINVELTAGGGGSVRFGLLRRTHGCRFPPPLAERCPYRREPCLSLSLYPQSSQRQKKLENQKKKRNKILRKKIKRMSGGGQGGAARDQGKKDKA